MVVYESATSFIESGTSIKDKITKIEQVISALMTTALKSATTDNITEYWLNDGQTQIKTVYKGTDAVVRSIESFEKIKQIYIAQYNKLYSGSIVRLVDSKNFRGGTNGR